VACFRRENILLWQRNRCCRFVSCWNMAELLENERIAYA
jgi:hypothetical protein